jgi:hypothetical protein
MLVASIEKACARRRKAIDWRGVSKTVQKQRGDAYYG